MSKITEITPRRTLHDAEPDFLRDTIEDMSNRFTWKKAVLVLIALVVGGALGYLFFCFGFGL